MNGKNRKNLIRIVLLLIGLWSFTLSWGLDQVLNATVPSLVIAQNASSSVTFDPNGSVDWVPSDYRLGQELYIENCATCHLAVPPQTFPTQTWQQLLQDNQHYGVEINAPVDPQRLLIWNYLQTYSRPLTLKEESVPYRFNRSRHFKSLHPRVEFPQPVTINTCVSCHPKAAQFNFRQLTSEWQNSP